MLSLSISHLKRVGPYCFMDKAAMDWPQGPQIILKFIWCTTIRISWVQAPLNSLCFWDRDIHSCYSGPHTCTFSMEEEETITKSIIVGFGLGVWVEDVTMKRSQIKVRQFWTRPSPCPFQKFVMFLWRAMTHEGISLMDCTTLSAWCRCTFFIDHTDRITSSRSVWFAWLFHNLLCTC